MNTLYKAIIASTLIASACSGDDATNQTDMALADDVGTDVATADMGTDTNTDVAVVEPDASQDMGPTGPNDQIACVTNLGVTGRTHHWVTTVDADDNLLIPGLFQGVIDFGDGPVVSTGGTWDAFMAKVRPDCTIAWFHTWGGTGFDHATQALALADGTTLVTGELDDTVQFGPDSVSDTGSGMFVTKIDEAGEVMWGRAIPGATVGMRLVGGANGNLFTAVRHRPGADFGSGSLDGEGPTVLMMDADLNILWDRDWQGNSDGIHDIDSDAAGRIAVLGRIDGPTDLGEGTMVDTAGDIDLVLAVYEPDGSLAWHEVIGGPGPEQSGNLSVQPDGTIYLTGGYSGDVDFGAGPVSFVGGKDAFVARYEADGELGWVQTFGGPGSDWGLSTALLSGGDLVVTGSFLDEMTIGPERFTALGLHDAWSAAFVPETGEFVWARHFGTTGNDDSYEFRDAGDEMWVVGDYPAELKLPGEVLTTANGSTFAARMTLDTAAP